LIIFKGTFDKIIKSTLEKIKLDNNSCMPRDLLEDFMSSRLPPFNFENEISVSTLGTHFNYYNWFYSENLFKF
jgi:hypothetical protein